MNTPCCRYRAGCRRCAGAIGPKAVLTICSAVAALIATGYLAAAGFFLLYQPRLQFGGYEACSSRANPGPEPSRLFSTTAPRDTVWGLANTRNGGAVSSWIVFA